MSVYYNEIDNFAADWLEQLIAAGEIPEGTVDRRDIRDVLPSDLAGHRQCHFFAGIGGWALALRLAEQPDLECWTGSCPCQPFSAAGRGGGFADERHLWPAFFHLVSECRPPTVFGEQVASKDGLGWLDLVHADLEGAGYAVGAADLCTASVGIPQKRQRLFFVARAGLEGRLQVHENTPRCSERSEAPGMGERSLHSGFLDGAEWIPCRDGNRRPVEPSIFPLAPRLPHNVGALCGAGNAIVPQVAAEFIRASLVT